jgi:hypothetical protein
MSPDGVIPDQIHIDKIREKLWCDREFGRAAVMVGAGFSRNAEKVSPNVPDFPLWMDLAGAMFDDLYRQGDPKVHNSRDNSAGKQRKVCSSCQPHDMVKEINRYRG